MTTSSHAREKQALQEDSAAKQARIAAEERAEADRIPAALERIAEALEIQNALTAHHSNECIQASNSGVMECICGFERARKVALLAARRARKDGGNCG